MKARSAKRLVWVVGGSLLGAGVCLAVIVWAGDRLATVLIDTLVKVMFWGFGFGWLKAVGL